MTDETTKPKLHPVNLDDETWLPLVKWAEENGGSIVGQIRRLVRQEKARRMYNSIREAANALPDPIKEQP